MCYFLPFFGELEIRFRHGTYLMVTQKTLSTFKEKEMIFFLKNNSDLTAVDLSKCLKQIK